MLCRENSDEQMTIVRLKTPRDVDLLHGILSIHGKELEFCGLAREEYKDGMLWQWWIVMDR